MSKESFTGRDAVASQATKQAEWTFVGLEITALGPEPLPSDPIVKNGRAIGYLTSISMGYRTGKLLAMGYVKNGALNMGETCNVQSFGEMRPAIRHSHHVYDPTNDRLRS
ncbi:MAG: glycine cleavage T C-terminal barrel domain-containing protein [Pseudomonadota bacterium]